MKKSRIITLVGLLLIAIVGSAWMLNIQTQKRILDAYYTSRETEAKVINGYYEIYIDNLNHSTLAAASKLNLLTAKQSGFKYWSEYIASLPGFKNSLLRVWWLSSNGDVLYASGSKQFAEDFASDPMFSSIEKGMAYSDLYSDNGVVYIRTICSTLIHNKNYVLVLDTQFGAGFVKKIRKLIAEEVALSYGYKIFATSAPQLLNADFHIPVDFLNAVRDKQEAGSQVVDHAGKQYLITAYPVLDFDQWDTKGYIVLLYPKVLLMELLRNVSWQIWAGAGLSVIFLILIVFYLVYLVRRTLTHESGDLLSTGFKLRMWLIAFGALVPVIMALVYVSFVPVPSIMAQFNSARIHIGSQEAMSVVSGWTANLARHYAFTDTGAGLIQQNIKLVMAEGGFNFVVLAHNGIVSTVGALPVSYSKLESYAKKIPDRALQLIPSKHGVLFLSKEITPRGMLIYGYTITKDLLRQLEDRIAADITIFIAGEPAVSTLGTWTLKTLKLLNRATWQDRVLFNKGKLRDIYHDIAFIPLLAKANPQKRDAALMLSVDDTPFQNNVTGYHFTVFALIIIILLIFGIWMFVILNEDRPRLLRSVFVGYTFLSPSLIHLFWWAVGPLLFAAYLAFHHWSIINPAKPFVGFGNFIGLMHDGVFWHSMFNTVIYTLQVPIGMALSLAIALAVNRKVRGIRLLRTVYYLPAVSSLVVTSIMWRWIYNPDFGILNYLLGFLGIPKLPWLTSPYMAMPAIMIMSIWMVMGQQMIIFLAGLQSIPPEYYDAAGVDGANAFQKFWYVTLPLLKPTTFFVLVTSVISSFQVFTPVYVLTQGGPVRSTDVAVYHIWQTAWQELRMGYAAAESWVLFGVILLFTLVEFRLLGKEIKYV